MLEKNKRRQKLTLAVVLGDAFVLAAALGFLVGFVFLPEEPVPPLPAFARMDVDLKKQTFFAYLSPVIARVNESFRTDRERLEDLAATVDRGEQLSWFERRWLRQAAERYELSLEEQPLDETLATLVRRAGVVPESIVLAQAAKESGWGTSRFAREGNNLFGQRCYGNDCGISPQGRPNARFGLAQFNSVEDSIESYVLNVNTHPSYEAFREQREALRESGDPVTGLALVDQLVNYSERRDEYVEELRALIRQNGLE